MEIINNILNKVKSYIDSDKSRNNSNKSNNKPKINKQNLRYNKHWFPTYSPANRKKSK